MSATEVEEAGSGASGGSSGGGLCRRLNEYSSRHVAEELCLVDSELLRKIDPNELQNGAWMKKETKFILAPNIMAMVGSFNQLALLIPTEILDEKTPQARAKVISTFIKVAHKCHALGNYNSLKAVLAGLQCTPIFRLKKTWKEVPSKRRKRFQYLCDRMSEDNNWQLYRDEVENRLKSQAPLIPFLGVFLTTVALSQEAQELAKAATSRERLDSQKRRRDSLYENYVILEAITVRKRLQKLRSLKSCDDPNECHTRPAILPESDSERCDLDSTVSPSHTPLTDATDNDIISNFFGDSPSHFRENPSTTTTAHPSSKPTSSSPFRSKEALTTRSMSIATPDDIMLVFPEEEDKNGDVLFNDRSTIGGREISSESMGRKRNRIRSSPASIRKTEDRNGIGASGTRLKRQKDGIDEISGRGQVDQDQRTKGEYYNDLSAVLRSEASPGHSSSNENARSTDASSNQKTRTMDASSNEKTRAIDASSNEKTRTTGERSREKSNESVSKGEKVKKKKKRMTLYNLRFRKKKVQEDISKITSPKVNNLRRDSTLSGSLECMVDAVSKEDTPPPCSDVTRSISLFNLSGELDDGEIPYLSDNTSISMTSERSMQSELHTSNDSLQRLKSEESGEVIMRNNKRGSLQGLSGDRELTHAGDEGVKESNKLEHRHSLKTVHEEQKWERKSHHVRNKSDTSMLPTFQHMYMYTYTNNSTSAKNQPPASASATSQNRFQMFGEHIKNTASNVFKRDRSSKPVVPMEIPSDPIDLLVQYQFLSLRCCFGVQGHQEIRRLIREGHHNTEGQNYKLSFEREPN